ncbi:MAG: FIST N-terminal domain-containing protein [Enterobacterales bacterium]|nr:FIST N-terminal domain-containing protein [Enterobacterales bacterium]
MSQKPAQIIQSHATDEYTAVKELKAAIELDAIGGLIFFCSSHYQMESLADALNQTFDCPITGCTTAGEIAGGYRDDSIVALVLSVEAFVVHPLLIKDLQSFDLNDAMTLANSIERQLQFSPHLSEDRMFGFLLSDGMSLKEENLIARLSQAFERIPIFGGSAGDNLEFKKTFVYYEGQFYRDAAILSVIEVKDDFQMFRTQHFIATDKELITTEVDFERRIVKQINGEPAADAFARINQLDPDNLTTKDFAVHPLMIQMADEWYIRSISGVLPDKSLQFYCAIDEGLPLSIAQGDDMLLHLENTAAVIDHQFQEIYFTLGCDCILRKVENIENDTLKDFENVLTKLNFIGFSSYGEQYNGVHFNQTLAAVVVGKKYHD